MRYLTSLLKLSTTIVLILTFIIAFTAKATDSKVTSAKVDRSKANSAKVNAVKVGDMAPDFNLMTTDGKVFQLKHWRGKKPVYIVFWNTWCPYCVKKMPQYQEVYTFHSDELEFIAINTGNEDPIENLEPFAERHQLDLPMAYDFGQKVSKAYGVLNTPTAFIVDTDGRIRFRNRIPEDVTQLIEKL